MSNLLSSLAVFLVVALGGYVLTHPAPPAPPAAPVASEHAVGAAGSDFTQLVHFYNNITVGGTILATSSTAATYTISAQELAGAPKIISWTPNVDTTLKFSASSTRAYVPNVGDTAQIYIRNASSTAASSITFAADDTAVDLQFAEATGGDLVLNGLDWAKVTLIRNAGNGVSQVTVIFDEMTEAD